MNKFSIVFNEKCNLWVDNREFNYYCINSYLQGKYRKSLKSDGYVLLTDIYRELGVKLDANMLTMGWHHNNIEGLNFKLTTNGENANIIIEFINLEDLTKYF